MSRKNNKAKFNEYIDYESMEDFVDDRFIHKIKRQEKKSKKLPKFKKKNEDSKDQN